MPNQKPRTRVDVSDPLAPVRISPVRVNGTSVMHKGIEVKNDDDEWQCINIHSPAYNLISNQTVQKVTTEILGKSGMAWQRIRDVWTGRYWARLYISDAQVEAPNVGDVLSLGLRVENSYDGSCQFRLHLMGYVLSCMNGLMSTRHFTRYTMRHTMNNRFVREEIISLLKNGIGEVSALLPKISSLTRIPLSVNLVSKVSRELSLPRSEWGYITQELQDSKTAWDLMQIITHRLSHHGRGKASLTHSESVGEFFLDRISA